ncbi:MAG: Serine/arginine-rich splicing factor 6 [Paramarteilia canceri]
MSYRRSSAPSTHRLYVGHLPDHVGESELRDYFGAAGEVLQVTAKSNFGFVDYSRHSELERAIDRFDGASFKGHRILVQEAHGNRRDSDSYDNRSYRKPSGYDSSYSKFRGYGSNNYNSRDPSKKLAYRVIVLNLSGKATWDQLKDKMKEAGTVNYVSCNDIISNVGIVEFDRSKDIKRAISMFHNKKMFGRIIKLIDPKEHLVDSTEDDKNGQNADDSPKDLVNNKSKDYNDESDKGSARYKKNYNFKFNSSPDGRVSADRQESENKSSRRSTSSQRDASSISKRSGYSSRSEKSGKSKSASSTNSPDAKKSKASDNEQLADHNAQDSNSD